VRKVLESPFDQTVTGQAPCGAFTLAPVATSDWKAPEGARAYEVKKPSLDLYDSSSDDHKVVTTLHLAPQGEKLVFFSTEKTGPWVHVEYHGEVVIDAWAHHKDLHPVKGGKVGHARHAGAKSSSPKMAPIGKAKLVKTSKKVPLRLSADASAPAIGHIEAQTETYVVKVVSGWASVLPKAMNIAPPESSGFWVPASDLGL
jgi:hypothetical protein